MRLRPLYIPAAVSVALAALVALVAAPARFLNYDTAYTLLWGNDLVHGRTPDYSVAFAPTPHPLATLVGAIGSLFGTGFGEALFEVLAFLALGILGWLVYALGRAWFNGATGVVAALIVLTREPVFSYGVRAYVDIPYICLLLGALLVETRRPRAGTPGPRVDGPGGTAAPGGVAVRVCLRDLALAWRRADPDPHRAPHRRAVVVGLERPRRHRRPLALADRHALDGGGSRARHGPPARPGHAAAPSRRDPARAGALRRRGRRRAVAAGGCARAARCSARRPGVLAVVAFCVLATAGLSILTRYLLLPATILAIFAAAAICGWTLLPRDDPWRLRWAALGLITALGCVAFIPSQVERLRNTRCALVTQTQHPRRAAHLVDGAPARRTCPVGAQPPRRPAAGALDRHPPRATSAAAQEDAAATDHRSCPPRSGRARSSSSTRATRTERAAAASRPPRGRDRLLYSRVDHRAAELCDSGLDNQL